MKIKFLLLLLTCAFFLDISVAGAVTYKVIYRFCSKSECLDGAGPEGGLTYVDGTLYGTTAGGGTNSWGTVFSLTPEGNEAVLHSFGNGRDGGVDPIGGVIDVGGILYGTTYTGHGSAGNGTVFSIAQNGTFRKLYSFRKVDKGILPAAGLVEFRGKLFGTTINGGTACAGTVLGCGTVFSITPQGREKVTYSFCQFFDCTDGQLPQAPLIKVGALLYGATYGGPPCPSDFSPGCGTIFSLDPRTDTEKVLYSFCQQPNCADGYNPTSGLSYADGIFYGTASVLGSGGTVFSLTPAGDFKVLHAFPNVGGGDGYLPMGVIDVKGTLYGTTTYGGTGTCMINTTNPGCGTVFSIDPSGTETVLYSFQGGDDGAWPFSGLLNVNGTLYGTTRTAGLSNGGTVFSIKP